MVPVATLLGAQHYKASTGFSSLTNHASLASHNEQTKKKKKKKKSLIIINVCIDRRTEWKTGILAKIVILLKYRNYYYYYYTEGWAFWQVFLEGVLSTHNDFEGSAESIPSFFLSFSSTSSHDFLGLTDLFCATTFSLRTSAIQPVLRSTCPNHLILLVIAPHLSPGCEALWEGSLS